MLPSFVRYYKTLGVSGFFSNINYRLECDREGFDSFIERVRRAYPEIIFNIGPNDIGKPESSNIEQIYELMKNNIPEDSYIIPADADEFHQYPLDGLQDSIDYIKQNEFLYIGGATLEKVSETGHLISVNPQLNIFEQFPKSNRFLYIMPKISLVSSLHMYQRAGVGHHGFYHEADKGIKNMIADKKSITHHFRWTEQGKIRAEKWHSLFTDNRWKGWSQPEQTRKRLKMYDMNLLECNWSDQLLNSL
jgi:hypothetical protein